MLDLNPINEDFDIHFTPAPANGKAPTESRDEAQKQGEITYRECNIADWASLRQAFSDIGHVDIAIANAGVSQESDYSADTFEGNGLLKEPRYNVMNVNLRAVLNFIKLSISAFRRQGPGGSIVLTASATAYAPEQSLPVYSAIKLSVSKIPYSSFHKDWWTKSELRLLDSFVHYDLQSSTYVAQLLTQKRQPQPCPNCFQLIWQGPSSPQGRLLATHITWDQR